MTCKDCIHYEEVCEYNNAALDDKPCAAFKDRSRFVELSHAEWVEDEDMYGDPIYRCSNCNLL